MLYPKEFEKIDKNTARLKVPGGWIVRTFIYEKSVHTFFFPDPHYNWVI